MHFKYTKIKSAKIIMTIVDASWLSNDKNNDMKTNKILWNKIRGQQRVFQKPCRYLKRLQIDEQLFLKFSLFFLLIDCALISIKPNGRAKRMTIITNDKIDEIILDPELNDSEYMSMQEAVNKGKNVKISIRCKNLQQQKREAKVNLQHLDLIILLI